MKVRYFASKLSDVMFHVTAGVLGADSIRNLYNAVSTGDEAHYQLATIEAFACVFLEVAKYSDTKRKRTINNFVEFANKFAVKSKETEKGLDENFKKIFEKIDKYTTLSA